MYYYNYICHKQARLYTYTTQMPIITINAKIKKYQLVSSSVLRSLFEGNLFISFIVTNNGAKVKKHKRTKANNIKIVIKIVQSTFTHGDNGLESS